MKTCFRKTTNDSPLVSNYMIDLYEKLVELKTNQQCIQQNLSKELYTL